MAHGCLTDVWWKSVRRRRRIHHPKGVKATLATMIIRRAATATLLLITHVNSFQTVTTTLPSQLFKSAPLRSATSDDNEAIKPSKWRRLARKILPAALAATVVGGRVTSAQASAPVMVMPQQERVDPTEAALQQHERRESMQEQQKLKQEAARAQQIAAEKGPEARKKYEEQVRARRAREQEEKAKLIEETRRELVMQGICPFVDIEGIRQMTLLERGIDLATIPGTPANHEARRAKLSPEESKAVKQATHRKVLACIAQDLVNRGEDPVEYFSSHREQTAKILQMPVAQAQSLLDDYEANLEDYGQITEPAPGEMSVNEKLAKDPNHKKRAKEEAKKKRAEEKARKKKSRVASADKLGLVTFVSAPVGSVASEEETLKSTEDIEVTEESEILSEDQENSDGTEEEASVPAVSEATSTVESSSFSTAKRATGVVILGGVAYTIKINRDRAAENDEIERQRQFKLLMEGSFPDAEPPTSTTSPEPETVILPPSPSEAEPVSAPAPAPTKPKLGLKSVFAKKKNDRETDINVLVAPDAPGAAFAATLAKILTYGAPGRFPAVVNLPGGMPMDAFDLEEAKRILVEKRESGGITMEQAAETFANVVNCMLIDIVDLASSSLKLEDDEATVKSINIVIDFMKHAASLYDSIAGNVTIKPVTYGGKLAKSKLEQMYSTYTVSGVMNVFNSTDENSAPQEDFDSKVGMLQDVFQFSPKRAEGLMMKAVRKNMMEMMKSGKGLEGMEGMLDDMGGMGGFPGMEGAEGDPSPEQLLEMLKSLKELQDSGAIAPSDFEAVKSQFKEAFGSSLDEMVDEARKEKPLNAQEEEMFELLKSIMED